MWNAKLHCPGGAWQKRSQLRSWCLVLGLHYVSFDKLLHDVLQVPVLMHYILVPPEILSAQSILYSNLNTGKNFHNAWSCEQISSCILYFHFISYTLLVGKPPFETSCLKETYTRIKRNEYHIPSSKVSSAAKSLIQRLLHADPTKRPGMEQVLQDEFFVSGLYLIPCVKFLFWFWSFGVKVLKIAEYILYHSSSFAAFEYGSRFI